VQIALREGNLDSCIAERGIDRDRQLTSNRKTLFEARDPDALAEVERTVSKFEEESLGTG
jgi:hypothetical protein